MRNLLLILCAVMVFTGCDSQPYSQDQFSRYERLAESNPQEAIEQLRFFVYHNPEHFESHLLLASLLADGGHDDQKKFYLARHYLNQASQLEVDAETRSKAARLYTQVRLEQGVDPENYQDLESLAEQLAKQDQHVAAAEIYLRGGWIAMTTNNLRDASSQVDSALSELSKLDEEQKSLETNKHLIYNASLGRATVSLLRGRAGNALQELPERASSRYKTRPFAAPTQQFLENASMLSEAIAQESGWGRRAFSNISRRFFGGEEDTDLISEVFDSLMESDLVNEDKDSPRLDRVLGRVWEQMFENLSAGDNDFKQAQARARAVFYYRRAGELDRAQALER